MVQWCLQPKIHIKQWYIEDLLYRWKWFRAKNRHPVCCSMVTFNSPLNKFSSLCMVITLPFLSQLNFVNMNAQAFTEYLLGRKLLEIWNSCSWRRIDIPGLSLTFLCTALILTFEQIVFGRISVLASPIIWIFQLLCSQSTKLFWPHFVLISAIFVQIGFPAVYCTKFKSVYDNEKINMKVLYGQFLWHLYVLYLLQK